MHTLRGMRLRRAGTLIELLVALVLLDLALLSLASVGAATVKRLGDSARRSRAVLAAANRLERLAAVPCASMSGGVARLEKGVDETWTVERLPRSVELSDSVEIATRPAERVVVRRRVPCA
jgi:Tfp pilus assembly protein PilV